MLINLNFKNESPVPAAF